MKDYKTALLNDIQTVLADYLNTLELQMIENSLIKILADYDISERCTDVAIRDNENERLLKQYLACLTLDGKSTGTIYQYKRTCIRLAETLGKHYREMTTYDIRYFLAIEMEKGNKNTSVENMRANISAFFQWLTAEEIIIKNPVARIKPTKCKQELKIPFSDIEIDALKTSCKTKKERAIIEMLLSTGVRVSELCHMEICDININELSVHVVEGKGDKERMTYTTAVSAKYLIDYINNRKEDNGIYLFYNKNHEMLNPGGVRHILNMIADRAGVSNVHPHRFRRTFATNLAKRGMAIQDIQTLLGHSDIATTMTYVCMDNKKVQNSYKQYIA